jgi:CO/xanthine dehydrogenase Mo-binding subunit
MIPDTDLPVQTLGTDRQREHWWVGPETARRVAGRTAYATDVPPLDGLLHGAVLRCGVAHARVVSLDVRGARAMPGVRAVVTAEDVPGTNGFGIVLRDQPVLCRDRVRFEGDAVAAVAADTPEQARAALAAIEVTYEPLPIVGDALSAAEAWPLHEGGNLLAEHTLRRGELDAALARCALVVEQDYRTPRQMHAFMETEGGVAIPDGRGGLCVQVGCQSGHRDRLQLADILGLAPEQVTIRAVATGGAFGGKDELTVQPIAGLLALRTGRPVRLHLDRFESCRSGIKRHPVVARVTTGCDRDGRLLAHRVDAVLDTGAYASLGPAVLENYLDHATAPLYRIEAYQVHGRLLYTNNGVAGAFRGFGGNQATFAVESQMDALAARLGLTPVEFRRRNLRRPGEPGSRGQPVRWTRPPAELLHLAARSPLWRPSPGEDPRWLEGTGLAMGGQGNGLGDGLPDAGGGRLSLSPEGRIRVEFGFVDYGQNLTELVIRRVSEALPCAPEDIDVVLGRSDGPDSGPTSASRSTVVVDQVLRAVLPGWARRLCAEAARRAGLPPEALVCGPGGIWSRTPKRRLCRYRELAASLGPVPAEHRGDFPVAPGPTPPVGRFLQLLIATVARVAVDRLSGRVRVQALHHITAAGRVIHPPGYLGQIEGAAVMGLGMTLTEDMPTDDGRYRFDNLDQYLIPTLQDAPEQRVDVLDDTPADADYPVRGVGELGIEAVAPAIVAAIEAACGVRVRHLPVDPDRLLAALRDTEHPV